MTVTEALQNRFLLCDGGMGTELQKRGLGAGESPEAFCLSHPEALTAIHRAYREAGADVLTTCTFGCHPAKLPSGLDASDAAFRLTKIAKDAAQGAFVAYDAGPTGRMFVPYGDLTFEEAVSSFRIGIEAGAKAGADLVILETFSDLYEAKAALIAAKEACDLPVFISFTFSRDGHLLSGADPETCVTLAQSLGAAAVGLNCGFGPDEMLPLLTEYRRYARIPVFVNANAGLPEEKDGVTSYPVGPEEFAIQNEALYDAGAAMLGGCCGTTPAHIKALAARLAGKPAQKPTAKAVTAVTSARQTVTLGGYPTVIGERLNPTGKKALKEALLAGDEDYILSEAVAQCDCGADVLDVNVGVPGIDEKTVMCRTVDAVQSVVSAPLCIDTSDPAAAEAALRIYAGIPLLNSVNGKRESMAQTFPLAQKYGACVVALTLDEDGIPENAEKRIEIAERIAAEAAKYGIGKERLIFDTLTMAISTGKDSALITLDALGALSAKGYRTVLGVSNISFGLPNRETVNAAFYARALERGLDAAILNPKSRAMQDVKHAFALLDGRDENAARYLSYAASVKDGASALTAVGTAAKEETADTIKDAILKGLAAKAAALAKEKLKTVDPVALIADELLPALEEVGRRFEEKTIFLPQLMNSAECARAVAAAAGEKMPSGARDGAPVILLATVKGDVHDIGKNIVRMVLESYGYQVRDLGRDVSPDQILDTVLKEGIRLVGLSALMTTTVGAMAQTVALLHENAPDCRVMVGGAVLTEEYAARIGADYYCADAMEDVRVAKEVFGK